MAVISLVDIGAAPNDGLGDPLRTAYTKTNSNDNNLNAEVVAATAAVAVNAGNIATNTSDISDHISDPTDAHAATAVSFTPEGTIAATEVQAAIQEVRDEAPLISSEDELAGQMQIAVVATLPGSPDANTIYFVTT